MAAITMSFDKEACRYAAAVQTNGYRVEMITDSNIKTMLVPLFKQWIQQVGKGQGPQHIYYFRDGVSEGQYSHVLDQEVADMKKALTAEFGQNAAAVSYSPACSSHVTDLQKIKWTVTVCTKRHHLRFFPKEGDSSSADKNNNALPGTLVERDITHP
jgi:eukaryotic translation initiation factor 2C